LLALPPRPGSLTDEQRRRNDTHSPWVVLLVLGLLFAYAYAFTDLAGLLGLPGPRDLASAAGVRVEDVFDGAGRIESSLWMSQSHIFATNADEMLVFFLLLGAAFLTVYFLPLPLKRDSLSLWTGIMVGLLYGPRSLALLLCGHLIAHLMLHPDRRRVPWNAAFAGTAGAFALAGSGVSLPVLLLLLPAAALGSYRWAVLPLLGRPFAAAVLRHGAVHSILLFTIGGSLVEGFTGFDGKVALGLLLFFGQWMRLILYHVDLREGSVPEDLPLRRYLANFLCPAVVPNWFVATVSQGYAYTENTFLSRDKDRVVLGGAWLLALGFLYLALGDWFTFRLAERFELAGVAVHWGSVKGLTRAYVGGTPTSTASVLVTSLLDLVKFTFYWGGVCHFKVGVWRICGFDTAPHFNNWLASTDFLSLWGRYTFHYREFLVRAFYYPCFFRFPRLSPRLRIALAIFVAAGVGNLVWGHGAERVFYDGLWIGNLSFFNRRWPYFFLLSAAIAATQLFKMGRRARRRPWTLDAGLFKDIGAAYLTIQLYALFHIFAYPPAEAGALDLWKVFLIGFGFRW